MDNLTVAELKVRIRKIKNDIRLLVITNHPMFWEEINWLYLDIRQHKLRIRDLGGF